MRRYEAIFQINHDGVWMDYVRHTVPHPDDATADARMLARKTGRPFRVRVEDWSDKYPDPDVYYGDWDKSLPSPAAQKNGVFKPIFY